MVGQKKWSQILSPLTSGLGRGFEDVGRGIQGVGDGLGGGISKVGGGIGSGLSSMGTILPIAAAVVGGIFLMTEMKGSSRGMQEMPEMRAMAGPLEPPAKRPRY